MLALALMILAVGAAGIAPAAVLAGVQVVEVVQPGYQVYSKSVICNGTLYMTHQQEIYLATSVVPDQIYVRPGDYVTQGTVLATMNTEQSEQVAAVYRPVVDTNTNQLLTLDAIPQEYLALAQSLGMSQESLAAMLEEYTQESASVASPPTQYLDNDDSVVPPTEIVAPMDGIVTQVGMREGTMFTPTAAAFTIGETSDYTARISIPEGELTKVQEGDMVTVRGSGLGENSYSGWISRIYPTAQKKLLGSSMEIAVEAEVVILEPDEWIKPGLSVEVEVLTEEPRQLLTLPYEAVGQDESNREYVYVLEGGVTQKRYITTGQELVDWVQIVEGISYGDVVIYGELEQQTARPILIKGRE